MRLAVVGHVEWVQFVRVEHTPAPGDIVHALEWWEEPGGGGSVAAVQLAKLGGSASFFTALGDDTLGHRAHAELGALGIEVWATFRPTEQRRAITLIDGSGERTITVIGERLGPRGGDPVPWEVVDGAEAVQDPIEARQRLARIQIHAGRGLLGRLAVAEQAQPAP